MPTKGLEHLLLVRIKGGNTTVVRSLYGYGLLRGPKQEALYNGVYVGGCQPGLLSA